MFGLSKGFEIFTDSDDVKASSACAVVGMDTARVVTSMLRVFSTLAPKHGVEFLDKGECECWRQTSALHRKLGKHVDTYKPDPIFGQLLWLDGVVDLVHTNSC